MRTIPRFLPLACLLAALTFAAPARAASPPDELAQLRAAIAAQQQMLESQRALLEEQQRRLAQLESSRIVPPAQLAHSRGAGDAEPPSPPPSSPLTQPEPDRRESARPEVAALPDAGGVLTPRGVLSYENGFDYANTTRNQFTFNGVQVSEVVLIGSVENFTARRQMLQYSGRLRLGLTDRLEADVRVPYVYRNDATSVLDTTTGLSNRSTIDGSDLGDIDAGLAWQINDGQGSWPYFVANVRGKFDNADGPYDVPYDSSNVATRLPVGSGFASAEASLTAIKVSDPAVLYGNIGYVYNHGEDVNKDFGTTRITSVEPGDAINASVGMGFAVNPDLSLSFGYKHSYVFPTEEETLNTITLVRGDVRSDTQQVGAFTTGVSYRLTDRTSLSVNVEAGVTADAPDVRVGVRVPITLGKVF